MESCTQALCDLALRFGEDDDEESGSMVGLSACCDAPQWQAVQG